MLDRARALGVDEDSARYVVGQVAADGKVTLVARWRSCEEHEVEHEDTTSSRSLEDVEKIAV